MIIDGKRATGVIPVAEKGDKVTFSISLSGSTIKTMYTFVDYGYIHEMLVRVPVMAAAASIVVSLHDPDYQTAALARYTSPALAEDAAHVIRAETLLAAVIPFKRFVTPGDILRVVANAGAGTESVSGFLILVGI